MANTTLDRITNNARLHCPGAIDDTIKMELFNVVDEFLKKTLAWQYDVRFTTKANTQRYELTCDKQAQIIRLLQLKDQNDFYVAATLPEQGVLMLDRDPEAGLSWTATVVLNVVDPVSATSGMPSYPDEVVQRYLQTFIDGTVGRLMAEPAKPYTNERLAVYHSRRFRNGMALAASEVMRQNTDRGAWTFPQTFAVRHR